jgi:hypothetical protein
MTTSIHLTVPRAGFTEHYWSVRDNRGSVSMTASYFTGGGYAELVSATPSAADFLAPTDDGWWVFDVVQCHDAGCDWPEAPGPSFCRSDTLTHSHVQPLWDRLRTAKVTDEAVFAELAKLHAAEFEVAA